METLLTATYSPEDNKLRLYSPTRLDRETYERVKSHGFTWAPKQELFVAPSWTPAREDFLLELCGEIGDEDTSLVDRAEQRAERFEDYSDNRARDAESARKAVSAIADNIPLGQPILVGHHSERHARRDAEKIENGMRRAIKMWDTSQYWKERAAGALAHAKYLERPDVRERRIKTIEADIRRMRASYTPQQPICRINQHAWNAKPEDPPVPHVWCGPKGRGGNWVQESRLPAMERSYARAIAHCERRLEYERAMLGDSGGPSSEKFADIQVGGRVLVRGEWVTVLRVTKKNGKPCSVRTSDRYVSLRPIEEIQDYQAPTEEQAAKVQAAMKKQALCNYPGEGFAHMTKAQWDKVNADYRGTRTIPATETVGAHRARVCIGYYSNPAEPDWNKRHAYGFVYLSDQKRVDPPAPKLLPAPAPVFVNERVEPRTTYKAPEPNEFDALRDALKAGVKVVTAPQLFPTPPDLARRMAEEAGELAGLRVLEPSAGTGNLIRAIIDRAMGADCVRVVAVEINHGLVELLEQQRNKTLYANETNFTIKQADFLDCNGDLGKFDRVLMNPPFADGQDIKHITHAITMLKPGGRLVAICANGSRQNEKLRPIVEEHGGEWEELPLDTFKESGTGVRTVLLTLDV